jgi:hypothetical protein
MKMIIVTVRWGSRPVMTTSRTGPGAGEGRKQR